jgi:hypothetical protein
MYKNDDVMSRIHPSKNANDQVQSSFLYEIDEFTNCILTRKWYAGYMMNRQLDR